MQVSPLFVQFFGRKITLGVKMDDNRYRMNLEVSGLASTVPAQRDRCVQEEALSICDSFSKNEIGETEARMRMGSLIYVSNQVETIVKLKGVMRGSVPQGEISEWVDAISIKLFSSMQLQGDSACFSFSACSDSLYPLTGWIGKYAQWELGRMVHKCNVRRSIIQKKSINHISAESACNDNYSLYRAGALESVSDAMISIERERKLHVGEGAVLLYKLHCLPLPTGVAHARKKKNLGVEVRILLKNNPRIALDLFSNPPDYLLSSLRDWTDEHYSIAASLEPETQAGLMVLALSTPARIRMAQSRIKQLANERG
jgi:hypothetical protein